MISDEDLLARAAESSRLLLFLDYDGTLAEFAPTPAEVQPNREVVALLQELSSRQRVAVAVISGRHLAGVLALLPIAGITLAGSYGVEIRMPDGERIERLRRVEVRPFLDTLLARWTGLLAGRTGFYLEDKGWSLAIHARFAQKAEAGDLLANARATAVELGVPRSFRVMQDDRFLEIAPAAANKRDGVSFLLGRLGPAATILYFGDDDKDREAFPAVHEARGLAAIVGDRFPAGASGADCRFRDPASLRAWLHRLASLL